MHIKIADHIANKFLKSLLQFTFLIPVYEKDGFSKTLINGEFCQNF